MFGFYYFAADVEKVGIWRSVVVVSVLIAGLAGCAPDTEPPNACGGTTALDAVPGSACGSCGTWACETEDSVSCRQEKDTQIDRLNCGGCGLVCDPQQACIDGQCEGADSAGYNVTFAYNGAAAIRDVSVTLFEPTASCADLAADPNLTGVMRRETQVDASGDWSAAFFPDLDEGSAYTVVVQAESLDHDGEVELAYGCADNNPAISNGMTVDVEVPVFDHIPTIKGTFDITHEFGFTGALPAPVRDLVELIAVLPTDPGRFVFGCPTSSTDPSCPAEGLSFVSLAYDYLPDGSFRDSIGAYLNSGISVSVARDALNAAADNWMSSSAPSWVTNSASIAPEVYPRVRDFQAEGSMRFNSAPSVNVDQDSGEVIGVLPADSGEQEWQEFVFNWSQGCAGAPDPVACATRRLNVSQLGLSEVAGQFDGTIRASGELALNAHAISLNYGEFLVAVIEKVVLPEAIGTSCGASDDQPCDSVDMALAEMFSCPEFANNVDSSESDGHLLMEDLCDHLINGASATLRDYASEQLMTDGSDTFVMETSDPEHCTAQQPVTYPEAWPEEPLAFFQKLGAEDSESSRCSWDVEVAFSDSVTLNADAASWGARGSF